MTNREAGICACAYDLRHIEQHRWLGLARAEAQRHGAQHAVWQSGVRISAAARRSGINFDAPTTVIPGALRSVPTHRLVFRLARQFRRENNYDFVGWSTHDNEEDSVAILAIAEGNAVGVATLRATQWRYWADPAHSFNVKEVPDGGPGWEIGIIWVAFNYRRHGYGRAMINAAARHVGVEPHEIAASWPVSDDGISLFRCITGDQRIWVT